MGGGDDFGLYGPGSVTWRVHEEPILFLAGLRSLFLQALHPRAIAGVNQHSTYREDPWGRLVRTSTFVATAIFGTTAEAEAAGRRVRAVHSRLRATDPRTGEEFRVDEPDLLRWVHVAEVESFATVAQRAGVRLSPAEVDAYYDEQRRSAALVGLDPATVPGSAAEVSAYYDDIRDELAMTKDAARALVFLAAPPLPWGLGLTPMRAAYTIVAATAFGLLPGWARRLYGVPGLPGADLTATLSVRSVRLALRAIPRRLYESQVHRSAMARAAATGQLSARSSPAQGSRPGVAEPAGHWRR
jgi:uncharacterized protein (DUF2236 family)